MTPMLDPQISRSQARPFASDGPVSFLNDRAGGQAGPDVFSDTNFPGTSDAGLLGPLAGQRTSNV